MSLPRIFISSDLKEQQKIILDEAPSHHILQVLRLQTGSPLIVFNNSGGEFKSKIIGLYKRRAEVVLEEFVVCNRESPLSIHLGQGISRGEKMDFTIQKGVELGVKLITPLFTKYCNVKLEGKRLEKRNLHWQNVAISAAEQSGRCLVPEIFPAKSLEEWIDDNRSDLRIVFDPNAKDKLSDIKKNPASVSILVGPEGGLSKEEIAFAKRKDFLQITLGPRILRTETGALTAISILQSMWGDI